MLQRRRFLALAGSWTLAAVSTRAIAQAYPSRPLTLIVPYAAGGNADITARLFADALSKVMEQAVIVENRAGGGGSVGATAVIAAKPDGYTLLFSVPGVFSVTPSLVKVTYGMDSIRPIGFVSKTELLLVGKKGGRYRNLADVVEAARARPGTVTVGYGGIGTPNHLALLNLEAAAGIRLNGVPYRGSAPMLQDLLGGQVELGTDQLSTSRAYIDAGTLTPLGVFGPGLAAMPSVPLISTLGREPYDVTTYLGLAAPRGTPDSVVTPLQAAMKKALEDQAFNAGLARFGASRHYGGGADYDTAMRREAEFIQTMVASGQLKSE